MAKFKSVDITKFNEKQVAAIELMSLPKRGGLTYKEIAEKVGISERQFHRWKDDPEFKMAVANRALENLYEEVPEVFNANLKRAKAGEVRSVELFYKLLGLLVDRAEVEVENKGDASNDDIKNDIEAMRQMLKDKGL